MKATLDLVSTGEKAKIKRVICGRILRKRLCEMGLYEGVEIKVVRNDGSCPLVLGILGSKIAIGRGQASKILIE